MFLKNFVYWKKAFFNFAFFSLFVQQLFSLIKAKSQTSFNELKFICLI